MISRASAVLALAGSAAAFAPMGTPALRKPVSAYSCCMLCKEIQVCTLRFFLLRATTIQLIAGDQQRV